MYKYLFSILLLAINMTYCFGQNYLKLGDDCFDKGDYACAKTNYDKMQALEYDQVVDIKISRTKGCISSLELANSYFSSENYPQAKEYYLKILNTNPKDEYATNQIALCSLIPILVKQKTYQSYMKENPEGFNEYKNKNCNIIEKMISELNGSGNVNYTTYINFDTLGSNLSAFNIKSQSINKIGAYINKSLFSELLPTTESGLFIPTSDSLSFDVSWMTYKLRANSRSSEIDIKSKNKLPTDLDYTINSFINNQLDNRGVYDFEIVQKELNGRTFIDIDLKEYRTNNGPWNVFYSAILPGWGTSKVADSKKGARRIMTLFLLSSAISIGSKVYSSNEYNKYKQTSNKVDGGKYYQSANVGNKVCLISGGIACLIYVYDISWVSVKGIKNVNKSKEFRNKLRLGPVKVQNSSIKAL